MRAEVAKVSSTDYQHACRWREPPRFKPLFDDEWGQQPFEPQRVINERRREWHELVDNAQRLHEVPAFVGNLPRVVMATFFGYSAKEFEVFVWS